MITVQDLAEAIVAREGGYVNDPDDPGGATKYGVTIHTMRSLGLDITGDGRVDTADVRSLSREQAVNIFINEYFHRPRISSLPKAIQPSVFDMQVNAGSNAVRVLQRMLQGLGYDIIVDGGIGPQTIRVAHQAMDDHDDLVDLYGEARRNYYYAIGDRRPASRKYARRRDGGKGGWITRAEEFMSQKARLTDAQHRARVSSWG